MAVEIAEKNPVPEEVLCPFTGRVIEIKECGNGHVMGIGQFYTTRLYPDRRMLLHDLCHRDGNPPAFSRRAVEAVREVVPPAPSTVADQLKADEKVEQKVLAELDKVDRKPVTIVNMGKKQPRKSAGGSR